MKYVKLAKKSLKRIVFIVVLVKLRQVQLLVQLLVQSLQRVIVICLLNILIPISPKRLRYNIYNSYSDENRSIPPAGLKKSVIFETGDFVFKKRNQTGV